MFIKNLDTRQFSTDILDAEGGQIRLLIQPGTTATVVNVDPFYVNQDKIHRQEEFRDFQLQVWFTCEPDDWVCFYGHFPAGDLRPAEKGSIIVGDGEVFQKTGPAADGDVLIWDSTQPLGVRFGSGGGGSGQDSLVFGAGSILPTGTTRYLFVGYSDSLAEVTAIQVPSPRTGTLRSLRVIHNILGTVATPITYRVRVAGVATLINVVLAANAASGADTTNTAAVTAGQPIDIEVTKSTLGGRAPTNIVAILEVN